MTPGSRGLVGVTTFGGDGGLSGISRYIIQLMQALVELPDAARYELLTFEDEETVFLPRSPRARGLRFARDVASPIRNVAWHQLALPRVTRERGYDVLFLPAANRRLPLVSPCPTVGTVHDLAAVHVDGKYDPARMFYIRQVLPALIRRLDHVLTVSESSRRDIIEHAGVPPEKITVTPLAADARVFHPGDREASRARVAEIFGVTRPFILYISRIEHPGKNHVALIRAFERLKAREDLPHVLVLAGGDRERADEVHAVADAARHRADIHFTGFVPGDAVPDLYRAADLFVFPSLYEGFGLPLLEAMACATPVITADVASLPEVGGDAAWLFEPHDEAQLASLMARLLTDEGARQATIQRGLARASEHTWERTAAQTREVLGRYLPL
jgi:glycosyltransferase involved in cell wall biosynthesis